LKQLFQKIKGVVKPLLMVMAFIVITLIIYGSFVLVIWKSGEMRVRSKELTELRNELAVEQSKVASLEIRIGDLKKRTRLEAYADTFNLKAPVATDILVIERDAKGLFHHKDEGMFTFLKSLMGVE
jgi:cell division protein FtsL